MKNGIYTSTDALINGAISAENAPITAGQFAKYVQQSEFFFNLLQQQIFSLDVTCSLFMERFIPEDERAAFKQTVADRVKAIAEDMAKKAKEAERKVHLV